jgi:two-component system alkaline phosphatase synthesis response regulator PhoP
MKPIKILVADDEADIQEILRFNLEQEGYEVTTVSNGREAIDAAKKTQPHLIILDVMMPEKNGMEVCEHLRTFPEFRKTLILFLTALNDDASEIKGLELGADDFLVKPLRPKALMTKIQAILRRSSEQDVKNAISNELNIDRERYIVTYKGREVILARKEFELLSLLASKPGKVFLRNEILGKIWGTEVIVGDRTIDVHIRKIRQKLELDCIFTIKGVGYKFEYPEV